MFPPAWGEVFALPPLLRSRTQHTRVAKQSGNGEQRPSLQGHSSHVFGLAKRSFSVSFAKCDVFFFVFRCFVFRFLSLSPFFFEKLFFGSNSEIYLVFPIGTFVPLEIPYLKFDEWFGVTKKQTCETEGKGK